MPFWVLAGATGAAIVIWRVGPIGALVPTRLSYMAPVAAPVLGILTITRAASAGSSAIVRRSKRRSEQARQRPLRVYRPMRMLFLDNHIGGSEATLAPRLRDRVRNAVAVLRSRRRSLRTLRAAGLALFDRQVLSAAEMDFGGSFPLGAMQRIAIGNAEHADATLLRLLEQANRSHCEDRPNAGEVTKGERLLAEHVLTEHDKLSRKLHM